MQTKAAYIFIVVLLCAGSPALAQQPPQEPSVPPVSEPRPGLLTEPRFISKAVDLYDRRASRRASPDGPSRDGFYLELGNMITGAGFLSAGPGYRQHVLNDRAVVSTSAAVSMRLYTMAQGTIEFPSVLSDRVTVGAQTLFRDALQVNYFGLGNASSEANRSGYRLRINDVTSYAIVGGPELSLRARIGWLQPVSIGPMAGRSTTYPDTLDIFTDREAPGLTSGASFLHGDVALSADTRDYPGHPTEGGLYQATVSVFADQKSGRHSFQRYELEAAQYLPLGSDKWVLALRGTGVFSTVTSGNTVPFYLTPSLGGRNLRSFADYRFHDHNMQSFNVESRWKLFEHLDTVAFVDLGSVAPTVRQLNLSDLKSSYGAGLRFHNHRTTIGRVDVAHGAEGWRILFRMNDPFRNSRQSNGWRPIAPFVP